MTMTLVQTITVGSGGAASIEFTGIDGDAKDLVLQVSARSSQASVAANYGIRFNGDSGSNYNILRLEGDGGGVNTGRFAFTQILGYAINASTSTANTFGNGEFYISNYASSAYKSVGANSVTENNATTAEASLVAGIWNNTAAITSILLTCDGDFVEHSTASLYSIS